MDSWSIEQIMEHIILLRERYYANPHGPISPPQLIFFIFIMVKIQFIYIYDGHHSYFLVWMNARHRQLQLTSFKQLTVHNFILLYIYWHIIIILYCFRTIQDVTSMMQKAVISEPTDDENMDN